MTEQCNPERPLTLTNLGAPAPGGQCSLRVGPAGPNLLSDSSLCAFYGFVLQPKQNK
jgi:hypothetical protein